MLLDSEVLWLKEQILESVQRNCQTAADSVARSTVAKVLHPSGEE